MNRQNLKPKAKLDIVSRKSSVCQRKVISLHNPINKVKNTPILRERSLNQSFDSNVLNRSIKMFNLQNFKAKQYYVDQCSDSRDLEIQQLKAKNKIMAFQIQQYQANKQADLVKLKVYQKFKNTMEQKMKEIEQKQKFHQQEKKALQNRVLQLQSKVAEFEQQIVKDKASRIKANQIIVQKQQSTCQLSRFLDVQQLKFSTHFNLVSSEQGDSLIEDLNQSKMQKSYKREYQVQKIKRINAQKMIKNAQQNARNEANLQINLLNKKIQTLANQLLRKKAEIQQKDEFINNLVSKTK